MLRQYQVAALEAIRAELRAGRRRVVLISPTGSGKTTIGAEIVRASNVKGSRPLWVAHRTVLIDQASARLNAEGIPHSISMGAASRPHRDALTMLGSIQTLQRLLPPHADVVIVDEAHHVTASGAYGRLLAHYPTAAIVGLTATPRNGMSDSFDALVVAATPRQLMDQGHLCRYSGFAFIAPELSGVHIRKGDYVESELAAAYEKTTIFADVVEKWRKHAGGRSTIVFAAGIENSIALVDRFRAAGIAAEHLDYRSPPSDRHAVFDRVRRGVTRVICNYSLLGEGLDLPMLKCVVLARPTKSWILATQMIGRGLRPWEGQDCMILDHAGVIQAHGLPDQDREYKLTEGPPQAIPSLTTCESCCAIWQRTPEAAGCPACGLIPAREVNDRTGPEQVDAHVEVPLDQIGKLPSRAVQLELFDDLVAEAKVKGWRPGAVVHRFKERFPGAPLPWGAYRKAVDKETKQWRYGDET